MAYQTYSGLWLAQSNASYEWLTDPHQTTYAMAGVDTAKIWQSYTLAPNSALSNLSVFGDGNYAAGNDGNNVLIASASRVLIYGGRGEDVFVGSGGSGTTFIVGLGEGNKVIENFAEGADKLRLIGGPLTSFEAVKSAMTQQGSNVVLNDGGTMILLRNTTVGQFHASDFQLPLNTQALGAQTFGEEFNNPGAIGTTWVTNYGYAGDGLNSFTLQQNGEQQIYTSASFHGTGGAPLGLNPYSFSNGVMTITAQPVSDAQSAQMWGFHYSSGMIESNYAQTYGYFEMRAELPHGQGLWPAFWLLGEQNKEIDVLEGLGSDTKVAYNALHSPSLPALGNPSYNPYPDGFHTYGVMWKPDTLTYFVDGTPVWQTATPYDMNSPMRMIVNLAVGGNWAGSPDGSTPWPAQMKVDYVRAYALPDASAPPPVVVPPPVVTPPPATGGQVLTSAYPGAALAGGAGADTLNASQGADQLAGGAGADTFAFKAMPWSAGKISDFQVGVDKLDLAALYAGGYHGADPVADGYVSFVADGAGGAKVMMDVDGPTGPSTIPFHVVTLQGVAPATLTAASLAGAAATAPPPPPPATGGQALSSHVYGDVLAGGSGADTLTAGQGPDQLTGGAGADRFVFADLVWNAGHVKDFQPGVDVLDLRRLFAQAGYGGSNPVADGYLRLEADGAGGTKVLFDSDGWGSGNPWPTTLTTLDHVSPQALGGSDWLFR